MENPINILLDLLNFEETSPNEFRAPSYNPGWNRVYGGQVIAQAIMAASKTVEKETCHSIHGYFMRPGDPNKPITYKIDPVRYGRSFQTRMVYAQQNDETIFTMGASYHKQEQGLDHQDQMGTVPMPEDLPNMQELLDQNKAKLPEAIVAYFSKERPIELRLIDIDRYINPQPKPGMQSLWIRTSGPINGDTALHQAALGYASDFTLLDTALIPHGKLVFDKDLMMASLDHSMWFHRPFQADEWLLYQQTSSNAFGARGLGFGKFFDRNGRLVASAAQEGLMRPINK